MQRYVSFKILKILLVKQNNVFYFLKFISLLRKMIVIVIDLKPFRNYKDTVQHNSNFAKCDFLSSL